MARAIRGDSIGLPARILGVVDVYCARTAARSYRDRVSPGQALYHLAHHPDRYDPHVVAVLAALAANVERSERQALPRPAERTAEGNAAA
jgi:HD-GYP domain-containing protein (c-di-GMP phosphodiesterase class II)